MNTDAFVYVTYIATPQEKVWQAIVDPDVMRQYWSDPLDDGPAHMNMSDWKPGSRWEHQRDDESRTVDIVGKVIEVEMSKTFTGGCACGAIRYEISDEPLVMNDCQCRDCQRRSGTGHGSYLTFPEKDAVHLIGEARHWDIAGDSGNIKRRAFCPACGSPVYLTFSEMPDLFTVHAASLDDPSRYRPQAVTYSSQACQWDNLNPVIPRFEKMPPP